MYLRNVDEEREKNMFIYIYGAHCPVDRIKDGLCVQVKPLGQSTVNPGRQFSVKRSSFLISPTQKLSSPRIGKYNNKMC